MGPVRSSMGPRLYLTPPGAGTSPAAEFKELRSCPPREKEPVQPWEGDALDVDIALILFLQLVCSGGFFLNLFDRLVTLLLRAASNPAAGFSTLRRFSQIRGPFLCHL